MEEKITVTVSVNPETQVFMVEFPDVDADSELGRLLSHHLNEVQQGFGQLTVNNAWVKLAHWPKIDEQKEGFGLTLFFE